MRTGTNIAHYRISELLGQGGMGEVYRAVDTRLDRPVALKFLARHLVSDPEAKERFIREAKAASALDHPNICTIHDFGETAEGDLYIVMALYEGKTLDARLQEESFDVDRTLGILRQLAQALKRAHAGGIVHRDLKPANVMVSDEDAVRLLDFGIAKLHSTHTLTRTGTTVGTAAYMSPEQAEGHEVTAASDVWALGVIAWQMLTGSLPFDGSNPIIVLHRILTIDLPDLPSLNPEVSPALAAVMHRALAKDEAERYPDAGAFLEALDVVSGRAPAAASSASPALAWSQGARRWVLPGLVATAAVIAGLTFLVSRGERSAAEAPTVEDTRNVVAILPFSVSGSDELAYLSEGLMDLIGGRLDGAGPLRTVDPRAVLGAVENLQGADLEQSAAVAASVGAGRFVTGQVVGTPGGVSISARMHGVAPDNGEGSPVTVEGSPDALFDLVDALAQGLLERSLTGANARIQLSAAQSSGSLEATKAFLRGEQFHRRGQFDSASAAYNRALALDSTFALAHLMKSMNNFYTYDTDDYAAAEKAMLYSGGLPERDRSLIAAFLDQQAGRLESAEQLYIAHLKRYPDEVKALLMLAMLYQRANPMLGRPMNQSIPLFERVLELEPENIPSLHRLSRLDAAYQRNELLRERADLLQRIAPGSEWAVDVETMSAFANNDRAKIEGFVEDFPRLSLLVRLYAAYNALRFSPDPRDADRMLARQTSGVLNPETGLPEGVVVDADLSLWIQVLTDLAAGRYERVRAFVTDHQRRRIPAWHIFEAELAVADVVPLDRAALEDLLRRVQAIDPVERLRSPFEPLHDIFTPAVATLERDVNAAKLLGRLGRFEEAWEIQRRIEAMPPFPAFESLREDAAAGLAADLLHLQGEDDRALELLRSARYQVPSAASSLSITVASHARFLRAELELGLGDREVARYLYEGMVNAFTPPDKIFLGSAYERLGQLHEAAGRRDEAIYFTEKLVRVWDGADPELAGRLEAARERLARLQAG